jgi:hypothetical protein
MRKPFIVPSDDEIKNFIGSFAGLFDGDTVDSTDIDLLINEIREFVSQAIERALTAFVNEQQGQNTSIEQSNASMRRSSGADVQDYR